MSSTGNCKLAGAFLIAEALLGPAPFVQAAQPDPLMDAIRSDFERRVPMEARDPLFKSIDWTDSPTAFGIALNRPMSIPPCTLPNGSLVTPTLLQISWKSNVAQMCQVIDFAGIAHVVFTDTERPRWLEKRAMAGGDLFLQLYAGNVVYIEFRIARDMAANPQNNQAANSAMQSAFSKTGMVITFPKCEKPTPNGYQGMSTAEAVVGLMSMLSECPDRTVRVRSSAYQALLRAREGGAARERQRSAAEQAAKERKF